MDIVRARADEAEHLRDVILASKQHWGYPADWMARWSERLQFRPEYVSQNHVYRAAVTGETCGFYALVLADDVAMLDHLWVLPGQIGTGIGRALFAHALQEAAALGAARFELEADPHAVGFYEHMGARHLRNVETVLEGTLPIMGLDLR